jgi:cell division protein FtsB
MRLQNKFVGISNRFRFAIKVGAMAVVTSYFIFQAISGKNGIISYTSVKKQVSEHKEILEVTKNKETMLEKNVRLLSNNFLDLDLLEERCRIALNYAFPDDIIINESGLYSSEM